MDTDKVEEGAKKPENRQDLSLRQKMNDVIAVVGRLKAQSETAHIHVASLFNDLAQELEEFHSLIKLLIYVNLTLSAAILTWIIYYLKF